MIRKLRTTVDVPIKVGMGTQLEERLLSLGEQEYLFMFSEERTIMVDDKTLTLTIFWSEAGLPNVQQWGKS